MTSPTEASLDAALVGGGLVSIQCTGTITVLTEKAIASDTTVANSANGLGGVARSVMPCVADQRTSRTTT